VTSPFSYRLLRLIEWKIGGVFCGVLGGVIRLQMVLGKAKRKTGGNEGETLLTCVDPDAYFHWRISPPVCLPCDCSYVIVGYYLQDVSYINLHADPITRRLIEFTDNWAGKAEVHHRSSNIAFAATIVSCSGIDRVATVIRRSHTVVASKGPAAKTQQVAIGTRAIKSGGQFGMRVRGSFATTALRGGYHELRDELRERAAQLEWMPRRWLPQWWGNTSL